MKKVFVLFTILVMAFIFTGCGSDDGNSAVPTAPTAPTEPGENILVTFNSSGGDTPSPTSKNVTYGNSYGVLATVTRTGYTFSGWYTGEGGTGSLITSSSVVSVSYNHNLYAKWVSSVSVKDCNIYIAGVGSQFIYVKITKKSDNSIVFEKSKEGGYYVYGTYVIQIEENVQGYRIDTINDVNKSLVIDNVNLSWINRTGYDYIIGMWGSNEGVSIYSYYETRDTNY